jgi:LPXTG-site transpeptidase (sortase) family protein
VPTAIDIPRIGVATDVVAVREEDDGAMAAPTDPDTVGWFESGVGVGTPGNVLLDGHVDWGGRLRVFGRLKELQPGDAVRVTDADGNVFTYSVSWRRFYDADTAPLDEIFGQTGDPELTLITCGGEFDASSRMYVGRWVVRAAQLNVNGD